MNRNEIKKGKKMSWQEQIVTSEENIIIKINVDMLTEI